MPFNSTDFTKAPWANGIMTLTHEECLSVLEGCKLAEENYTPEDNEGYPITDFYILSRYNMIDWTKSINGDTYSVLKQYNVEVNKLGINEQGIVQEEVVEETPTEEVVVEETPQENEEVTPAE